MLELAKAIISLLNAVGAGVIANYISENINKWLSSGSAGKKHYQIHDPRARHHSHGGHLHTGISNYFDSYIIPH